MYSIGVIDTGVDINHKILQGYINVKLSKSFIDESLQDNSGHGTGVCGVILSGDKITHNNTEIIMCKISNGDSFNINNFIKALEYLISLKVFVINMSLSIKRDNIDDKNYQKILDLLREAIKKDIVIVGSSGNSKIKDNILLDIIDEIFLITSLNCYGKIASYSKKIKNSYSFFGGDLTFSEDGNDLDRHLVYSSYPTNLGFNHFNNFGVPIGYCLYYGTSIATANCTNKILNSFLENNYISSKTIISHFKERLLDYKQK